jgi:predicted DCC family thiol-disulfide oxidoreductase YuxK
MSRALRGWILYDQSCGVCARWVPFWGPWLRRQGYGFRPLQDPWVAQQTGLHVEDLLRDIRLITLDGQVVCGADVYRQVLSSSLWTQPLALFTRAPLLRQAFNGGYRLFARYRYRVSEACGWAPPSAPRQKNGQRS